MVWPHCDIRLGVSASVPPWRVRVWSRSPEVGGRDATRRKRQPLSNTLHYLCTPLYTAKVLFSFWSLFAASSSPLRRRWLNYLLFVTAKHKEAHQSNISVNVSPTKPSSRVIFCILIFQVACGWALLHLSFVTASDFEAVSTMKMILVVLNSNQDSLNCNPRFL